jgi:hypothetical protein
VELDLLAQDILDQATEATAGTRVFQDQEFQLLLLLVVVVADEVAFLTHQ